LNPWIKEGHVRMSKGIVLLQALAATPKDLGRALMMVSGHVLHHRTTPGMWSIADVLDHMARTETHAQIQIRRLIEGPRPTISPLLIDMVPLSTDEPKETLLAGFGRARNETLAFLQGLSPGDWRRPGLIPDRGETRLRFLVQELVDHDTQRLHQIVEMKAHLRARPL
jgi:hypothetical protein